MIYLFLPFTVFLTSRTFQLLCGRLGNSTHGPSSHSGTFLTPERTSPWSRSSDPRSVVLEYIACCSTSYFLRSRVSCLNAVRANHSPSLSRKYTSANVAGHTSHKSTSAMPLTPQRRSQFSGERLISRNHRLILTLGR